MRTSLRTATRARRGAGSLARLVGGAWLFAACWLAAATARAQGAPPTEEELLRGWLARSAEVGAWRAAVGAARFDVVTAALWPNPQLNVNFMATPEGTPPDARLNYGAQLAAPLPVFGQVSARRGAAAAALRASEVDVARLVWERAADLEGAMVDRAFASARAALVERNLAEMAGLEEVVARRVNAGASSPYDAVRVSVAASTMRADLETARVERDRAESELLALLADPSRASAPVERAGLSGFRGPEGLDALLALARRRRPDLELARRGVAVAESSASRFRAEARPVPTVALGGYFTHDPGSLSVVASLSLPLPVFDRNQGLVGRARVEADRQRALVAALEARVAFEVTGAWRARADARAALERFRAEGLRGSEELLRRALASYQLGGSASRPFDIADLFDAYRARWDARAQELALERASAVAEAALERATALVVP